MCGIMESLLYTRTHIHTVYDFALSCLALEVTNSNFISVFTGFVNSNNLVSIGMFIIFDPFSIDITLEILSEILQYEKFTGFNVLLRNKMHVFLYAEALCLVFDGLILLNLAFWKSSAAQWVYILRFKWD